MVKIFQAYHATVQSFVPYHNKEFFNFLPVESRGRRTVTCQQAVTTVQGMLPCDLLYSRDSQTFSSHVGNPLKSFSNGRVPLTHNAASERVKRHAWFINLVF